VTDKLALFSSQLITWKKRDLRNKLVEHFIRVNDSLGIILLAPGRSSINNCFRSNGKEKYFRG
jgi:hypothetical protein